MLYIDNIIFSLQRHGGISVLWGELIKRALTVGNPTLSFLEYGNADHNHIRRQLNIPPELLANHRRLPLIIERYLSPRLKTTAPFIFHSSYYRTCPDRRAINITTVHDFTYERFAPRLAKKIHTSQKYKAIRQSDLIICVSHNTKRDLLRILPDIPQRKIRVIHNGASDTYHPIDSPAAGRYSDHIVYVGAREGYKNFNFAVECAAESGLKLLVAGSPTSAKETALLNSKLGPKKYLSLCYPSDIQLNEIYNSARCLLYPSLYEGFGIPVIEAQKAGCPVIAMNASSIPEIIGPDALLLNQTSIAEFKKALSRLESSRETIIAAGLHNAALYSWEKTADAYLSAYQSLT